MDDKALPPAFSGHSYAHINQSGSHPIKPGMGVLQRINVNTGASGASVRIYDGTGTSGPMIGNLAASSVESVPYGNAFVYGLFVVVNGNPDLTIIFD